MIMILVDGELFTVISLSNFAVIAFSLAPNLSLSHLLLITY